MTYPQADRFVVGVNLPWVGYGTDIGASAWSPDGGLSAQLKSRELLDRTFAMLAADGVSIVRTFLLCDLRSGVRFDRDGVPVDIDNAVFPDMDVLVAAARRHGIRLIATMLDFHLCGPLQVVNGVQLGGRAGLLLEPAARAALVQVVLRPIFERYGTEDAIAAWDLMNEPEWCIRRGPLGRRPPVTFDALQDFLAQSVASARIAARQPITVGCAGVEGLDLVRPLGLDFYQVHWYEKFGWAALERPITDLDVGDAPVLLGEFPGRSRFVPRILDTARRAGYSGALIWSVLAEDNQSAYPAV